MGAPAGSGRACAACRSSAASRRRRRWRRRSRPRAPPGTAAPYAQALVAKPPGVRDDWDMLLDLAAALRARGVGRRSRGLDLAVRAARLLGARRVLDLLLRLGPHRL